MNYQEFLKSKHIIPLSHGFEIDPEKLNPRLKAFQKDFVRWSVKRGMFGGFLSCGLGKTFLQLEASRLIFEHTGKNCLIICPLAVAQQTKRESEKFQIDCPVTICQTPDDLQAGINLVNYERMHNFDYNGYAAVMLDEGSIIKSVDGHYRRFLFEHFSKVPYKMTWTATPAPNDFMEIGNQAQFCNIMTRGEMLSMFFVHDGGETAKWRLKGHAEEEFWNWMASWSVMMNHPADMDYDDSGYDLPPLNYHEIVVKGNEQQRGLLFNLEAKTLADRRAARKNSIDNRLEIVAEMVNNSDKPWVIWCNYNQEGERLDMMISDAVEVAGRHTTDEKEGMLNDFVCGRVRVLITKPKIGGFGLNLQHCSNTVIYPTDSWEQWYQMIRRFWRFGQVNPVDVYYVVSEEESAVVQNIIRKEEDYKRMFSGIVAAMKRQSMENIKNLTRYVTRYNPQTEMEIPSWLLNV